MEGQQGMMVEGQAQCQKKKSNLGEDGEALVQTAPNEGRPSETQRNNVVV